MEFSSPAPAENHSLSINFLASIAFYGMLLTVVATALPYGTVDPWLMQLVASAICFFGSLRMIDGVLKKELRFAEPKLLFPLFLILLFAFVQILPLGETLSLDPSETRNTATRFAGYLVCAEVLFYYADSRNRLKMIVAAVLITGIGSALFAWLRVMTGLELPRLPSSVGFGQFINRNHFAFLAEMTVGLLAGLIFCRNISSLSRLALGAAGGLLFLSMIFSNSRGAIFGLAAMGFAAIILSALRTKKKSLPDDDTAQPPSSVVVKFLTNKVFVTLFALVLGGVLFIFAVAFVGGDPVVSRIEKLPTEVQATETATTRRLDFWAATIDLIAERPFFGAGFGAYGAAITKHDRAAGNLILQQAHNDYLELAASGGALSVLLIIAFFALFFRRAAQQLNSADDFRRAIAFGSILGIVAVLFHSVGEFGLHTSVNAFVFVLLIVLAAADIEKRAAEKTPARPVQKIAFVVCLAAITLAGVRAFQYGVSFFLSDTASATRRLGYADRAVVWDAGNYSAFETRGQILFIERNYPAAAANFQSAIALRPNDYLLKLQLASVYMQANDYEKAREVLRDAERLAPHYAAPQWFLGKSLLAEKNYDEAFIYLNRAANRNLRLFPELLVQANFVYFNDAAIDRAVVPETHEAKMMRALFYIGQNIASPANDAFMTGGETTDAEKDQFVERFLRLKNYEAAHRIWKSKRTSPTATDNPIVNGGFEEDLSVDERGFGWQIIRNLQSVEITRTDENALSGVRALRVKFDGVSDPSAPILSQLISLKPNTSYRLSFAVIIADNFRSGGLPLVELTDAEAKKTLASSPPVDSTGGRWRVVNLDFQTGSETRAAVLMIKRRNCSGAPCPAFGNAFFDEFKISGR